MPTVGRYVTVDVARLPAGSVVSAPILEASQGGTEKLLLSAGQVITPTLVQTLARRGVSRVRVHEADLADSPSRVVPKASTRTSNREPLADPDSPWRIAEESHFHEIREHGATPFNEAHVRTFRRYFNQSVRRVDEIVGQLAQSQLSSAADLHDVTCSSIKHLDDDIDLFASFGVSPSLGQSASQHSLRTAFVAMSIGTMLGLRRPEIEQLGIGCLVHDVGMLHIDERVRQSADQLRPSQFLEVTKHPIISYDLVQHVEGIPLGARMVAYQMHERCDGSGYPRGRTERQIHPLARIAAVADVFVAMVSPRPYRPTHLPYEAVRELLVGVQRRKFDRHAVRGLVHTMSLFPIGSFVQADDGRIGRVVRANGNQFTQPVVELWQPGDTPDQGTIVDLACEEAPRVERALPPVVKIDDDE